MAPLHLTKRIKYVAQFFALFAILLAVSACDDGPLAPLKIGTNVWPGYEFIYLSRDIGKLDPDAVELKEFVSTSEVARALKLKQLDGAGLTLDEAISLTADGVPLQILLVADFSNGADAIVARQGVNNIADLVGKKLGYEATAVGAYLKSRFLEVAGLRDEEIELINIDVQEHEAFFKQGKVDAVVTFEPTLTKLVNRGGKVIFSSAQIPMEIVDVLVIRKDVLELHEKHVSHLKDAWFETVQYWESDPQAAHGYMKKRLKWTFEESKKAFANLTIPNEQLSDRFIAPSNAEGAMRAVGKIQQILLENNLVSKKIDALTLLK